MGEAEERSFKFYSELDKFVKAMYRSRDAKSTEVCYQICYATDCLQYMEGKKSKETGEAAVPFELYLR